VAKRKRVARHDWRKEPAPAKGTPLRKLYERSVVYRERQARAFAGARKKKAKAEKKTRERARRGRIREARKHLDRAMKRMLHDATKGGDFWSRSKGEGGSHANWYKTKEAYATHFNERDFESILEALSDDFDLDEIGWDVIY
jgi:hypothetical protein